MAAEPIGWNVYHGSTLREFIPNGAAAVRLASAAQSGGAEGVSDDLREQARHLGRVTQFGPAEWLEAFAVTRWFRAHDGTLLLTTGAERQAVDRIVIDAARAGFRPAVLAANVLGAMADYRNQRDERRRGGRPLAVNGHEYQRRLRNRRRRRRR